MNVRKNRAGALGLIAAASLSALIQATALAAAPGDAAAAARDELVRKHAPLLAEKGITDEASKAASTS